MNSRGWHAVDIGNADIVEVRELFEQVFAQRMSHVLWEWKYAGDRGIATGTRDSTGQLLAHYGGTARTLIVSGASLRAAQLGDVMVTAHARGILSRSGPFATAAKAFIERHVGRDDTFALGFGFPNARHARLGEALGLYVTLGEVKELTWTCDPKIEEPRLSFPHAPIDWGSSDTDQQLDRVWQQLRQDAQEFVVPQRDARWWRHRFANHPDGAYRCWWVLSRVRRRVVGAIALRAGHGEGSDWELLDWLGPMDGIASGLSRARAVAAEHGAHRLHGWFSEALAVHWRTAGASPAPVEQTACHFCVTRERSAGAAQDVIDRPWWLTGGDTDFR